MLEGIQKLKSDPLRTQVYTKLKEKLAEGAWSEGEKIPSEHELCEMFGVSRVTVRAAIQQLEILGLVETKQGGGTFVKTASFADQLDTLHPSMRINKYQDLIGVLEYRKIIETGTVALARKNVTPADIEDLETIYQTMLATVGDSKAFGEADIAFHYKLGEISRNPIVIKVYELIYGVLADAMTDIVSILGTRDGLKYHWMLIDAMINGDVALCRTIMEEHIEVTIQRVKENANS